MGPRHGYFGESKGNADEDKIKIMQIGYSSEWALAKFFPSLFSLEDRLFELSGICGVEENKADVRRKLQDIMINKTNELGNTSLWRAENAYKEVHSSLELLRRVNNDLAYHRTYDPKTGSRAPPKNGYDAISIFTNNPSHIEYISSILNNNPMPILCEKPLVTLTNQLHEPDETQLRQLESLVSREGNVALMDSEHYSFKIAALAFYQRLGELIANYGKISNVRGVSIEKDDPSKARTQKLLSLENRTGILLDMGVHYFYILNNVGGEVPNIRGADYGRYLGYNVETFAQTEFDLKGPLFHQDAKGDFKFLKFSDRLSEPFCEDEKWIEFTLENKSNSHKKNPVTLTMDFRKGTLKDGKGNDWSAFSNVANEEYDNSLKEFHESIFGKRQPVTSFKKSLVNLQTIFDIYAKYPVNENLQEVYLANNLTQKSR